ncbi:3709_t:CDS:1, partial [Racocetra persica]
KTNSNTEKSGLVNGVMGMVVDIYELGTISAVLRGHITVE